MNNFPNIHTKSDNFQLFIANICPYINIFLLRGIVKFIYIAHTLYLTRWALVGTLFDKKYTKLYFYLPKAHV